jgi:pimeloyl-ACP methyl ester carboxylesterase
MEMTGETPVLAPPLRHYLGEARIVVDWLRGRMMENSLAARFPGDGRPVIVLPGLFTGDARTRMLRRVLSKAGYRAFGWGMGRNMPIKPDILERFGVKVASIHAETGQAVTLVGWSLGGIIAREFAKIRPDLVREVITLGSPYSGPPRANRAWRVYELFSDHKVDQPPIAARLEIKPPVKTTAIWSPRDGIIPPRGARGLAHERDAEIEVNCGHFALTCAPDALAAILGVMHASR